MKNKYYECYDTIAKDDLKNPFDSKKEKGRHEILIRFLGPTKNKIIIDVGCADGRFLKKLRAKKKYGIEIAEPYINNFKDKTAEVIKQDAEKSYPKKFKNADIIICSEVLEHVLNPKKVIKNIHNIMSKNSTLIIGIPYNEDLKMYEQYKGTYEFTHLRSFTQKNIPLYFSQFKIIETKGHLPKNPFYNKNVFLRKCFTLLTIIVPYQLMDFIFIKKMKLEPVHLFLKMVKKNEK